MEARTQLAVLVLQLSLVALGGAAERCAQPGALRCEEGRHQTVCLERSRVWHRVSDCAASGGFCAHGRCVGGVHPRAADDKCPDPQCNSDCSGIEVCYGEGIVINIDCGNQKICEVENGVPQCVSSSQEGCPQTVLCTMAGNIPDLGNPSNYYSCSSPGAIVNREHCTKEEGFFNPCLGLCDSSVENGPTYEECDGTNNGQAYALFTNPSLYYICIGGQAYWNKCSRGYFDVSSGKCSGICNYCNSCELREDEHNISNSSESELDPTPTTTTQTSITPDPSACLGPTDRIPDPTDQCWYYYCLVSGGLDRRRCDSGTIFVASYRKCVTAGGACT